MKDKQSFYYVGPGEFIYLLENADMIFTDSYHGIALSIIFEKPFMIVVDKNSQRFKTKTRIEDLINLFEIKEVVIRDKEDFKRAIRAEINYSDVKSRLSELRRRSLDLLKEALMGLSNG